MFWSGYSEHDDHRHEFLLSLGRLRESELIRIRNEAKRRREEIDSEINVLRAERQTAPQEQEGIRLSLETSERERRDVLQEVGRTRESVWTAFSRLVARRQTYREEALRNRLNTEAEFATVAAHNAAEADLSRLEAELRAATGEWIRRALAAPEWKERIQAVKQRLEQIQVAVGTQNNRAEAARAQGMTSPVAGFLVWAGYMGMGAFGWFFGNALHQAGAQGPGLIRVLLDATYRTFAVIGLGASIVWIIAFALIVLLIAPFVLWIYDRVLRKFDHSWMPLESPQDDGRRNRRGQWPKTLRERDKRGLSWESILARISGDIERSDYRQHLAQIPLLFGPILAVAIGLLFFSMGESQPQYLSQSLSTFMYFVVGVSCAATLAGLAMVFLTRGGARLPSNLWSAVLGLVTGLAVAGGLWTVATRSASSVSGPWAAGTLAVSGLLLVTNAIVLAQGLIYRHLHREVGRLRKDHMRVTNELDRLQQRALAGYSELYPDSLAARWDDLTSELEKIWPTSNRNTTVNNTNSERKEPSVVLRSAPTDQSFDARVWSDVTLRETAVTQEDLRMAPVETLEVTKARTAYLLALRKAKAIRRRRTELLDRLREIGSGELFSRISKLQESAANADEEGGVRHAQAELRYAQLRAEAEMAFLTGVSLRERIALIQNDPTLRFTEFAA